MEDTKICTKCGEILPLSEFGIDKNLRIGRRSACKACYRIAASIRYFLVPEVKEKAIACAKAGRLALKT